MDTRTENSISSKSTSWIDKYYDRIYPVILRMVANEEIAKDLTQEAFLRAWEKRKAFRGDADIGTWLYRIAVNVTLTYLGKCKRNPVYELEEAAIPGKSEGIQRKMERASEGEIVKKAIAALPPAYRITLIMHYYDDMKLEQIAKSTGISKGTAAWRLFRARKMIIKDLLAHGIDV